MFAVRNCTIRKLIVGTEHFLFASFETGVHGFLAQLAKPVSSLCASLSLTLKLEYLPGQ